MKMMMTIRLIIFIFIALHLNSCNEYNKKTRPENVPKESIYCGGKDGGVWVKINSISKANIFYYIKIYNEYNGNLWFEGKFKLNSNCKEKLDLNKIKNSLYAWTDEKIILDIIGIDDKYCFLYPVNNEES